MPTILFLFFLLKQQISLFQIMTHCSSRIAAVSSASAGQRQTQVTTEEDRKVLPVHFLFFFNVLLVPLLFKFHDEALVRDKAAVSDHEARSKYRPGPGSRACARTCVSSNTPSRLGLTRENRLCVNTHSDLDLRREGEEERWMEI